jgi:hypothetical protein
MRFDDPNMNPSMRVDSAPTRAVKEYWSKDLDTPTRRSKAKADSGRKTDIRSDSRYQAALKEERERQKANDPDEIARAKHDAALDRSRAQRDAAADDMKMMWRKR